MIAIPMNNEILKGQLRRFMVATADTTGEWLAFWRRRKGISQAELCRMMADEKIAGKHAINLDQAQYSRMERDSASVTDKVLLAISKVYGINVHTLLTGEDVAADIEVFITPEANEVGVMLDQMDEDLREAILDLTKDLLKQERRSLQNEIGAYLQDDIDKANKYQQQQIKSILSKIRRR